MRLRLAITLDVVRPRKPEPQPEAPEQPPMVDHKGSFVLERSGQGEPDEMRSGVTEHWYRAGFRPNEERR